MRYMETAIFKETSKQMQERTGMDVRWIVAACVALHSAKEYLLQLRNDFLDQVKSQVTSSIILSSNDGTVRDGLIRFVRRNTISTSESWFSLRG